MLVGLFGAPVFAKFSGGFGMIAGPTFGFIFSFILAAYVTGWIIEKGGEQPSIARFIAAALVGMVINYVVGTNWMYFAYKYWAEAPKGFSYSIAWSWMLVPLPKDVILSIIAGIISPRFYATIRKFTAFNRYVA